jgi:hypothetical protein
MNGTKRYWYQLTSYDGKPVTDVDDVYVESPFYVATFRDAVKVKLPNLNDVASSQLAVYSNMAAFVEKQ